LFFDLQETFITTNFITSLPQKQDYGDKY